MEQEHKRVAFFLENLAGGGAERNMVTMANYLKKAGYPVDVVLSKAEGQFINIVSSEIKIKDLKANSLYASLPKLVNYINQTQPQVLISTLDLANLISIIASKLSKVKPRTIVRVASTISVQSRSWPKKILERILLSLIYPYANEIITVSAGVAEDLARYIGISTDRLRVLYSPVITPEIQVMGGEPVDHPWFQLGMPPVIIGVGRFNHAKNFPRLIQAFSVVRQKREANLIILGDGELRPQLEKLVNDLDLQDFIELPGFINNPYPYLKYAGVFVLTSDWEGLPTVLIEAMACGCPVVATDCPSGPTEILAGGEFGELVPFGDDDALVQAIHRVLDGQVISVSEEWLRKFHIETFFQEFVALI